MAPPTDTSRAVNRIGCAVAVWSFLYLAPHLYWACGGALGFAALHPSIQSLPEWRTINWIASIILSGAALIGVALCRPPRNRMARRAVILIAWAGSSVATAHGLVGIAMRIQAIAAWSAGARAPGWLYWDVLVFEPWFLIEGVLLGLSGWALMQGRRQRGLWVAACTLGTALAIMLALLRVKFA